MGLVTLRPNAVYLDDVDWVNTGGAASKQAAVSDQSDTTYLRCDEEGQIIGFELEDGVIPGEGDVFGAAVPVGLRAFARAAREGAGSTSLEAVIVDADQPYAGRGSFITGTVHGTPMSTAITTASIAGGFLTIWFDVPPEEMGDRLAAVRYRIRNSPAQTSTAIRVHDLWLEVTYNEAPVVTVTGPASPVVDTDQPTVTWDYTDPESDAQHDVLVLILKEPVGGWPVGFDPAVSPLDASQVQGDFVTSMETSDPSARSLVVDEPLENGDYRAYMTARDDPPAFWQRQRFGLFDFADFTVTVTPPDVPTITGVTADAAEARMEMTLNTGAAASGTTDIYVSVQRSLDAGATWEPVRFLQDVKMVASDSEVVFDYFAPRGASVRYRARASDGMQTGNPTVPFVPADRTSAWSTATTAVVQPATSPEPEDCVFLKSSSDPAFHIDVCLAETRLSSESAEPQAVFQPRGRSTPIVHSLGVKAEVFDTMRFAFDSDATWEAFEALRGLTEPVLLQLPYGDTVWEQYWVRFGDRDLERVTYDDMAVAAIRVARCPAREVPTPSDIVAGVFGA